MLQSVKVSSFINEANLQSEIDKSSSQLANIESQISSLESQIAGLRKQRAAIESNMKDIDILQDVMGRLKLRETEGIR